MNLQNRMIKDSSLIIGVHLLSKAVGFMIVLFIARAYGSEALGRYAYALSFATIFITVSDFNLSGMLIREIAIDRKNTSLYIGNTLYIKIVLSALAIVAIFIGCIVANRSIDTDILIFAMALYLLLNTFNEFCYSIFKAYEKNGYVITFKIMENAMIIGFLILFTILKLNITLIIAGFAFSSLIMFFVLTRLVRNKLTHFSILRDKNIIRHLVHEAMQFGIALILTIVFFSSNILLLSFMSGDKITGIFSAAQNIFLASTIILQPLSSVLLPTLSRKLSEHGQDRIKRKNLIMKIVNGSAIIFLFGIIITILYLLFSQDIVAILYGKEYLRAARSLDILSLGIPFWFVFITIGTIFSSLGRQAVFTKIIFAGVVINAALSYVLILFYAEIGAAVAFLTVTMLMSAAIYIHIFLYLKNPHIGLNKSGETRLAHEE